MTDDEARCPDCYGWEFTLKECGGVVEVPCANLKCKGGCKREA
ncbi:hypothetical protein ACFLVP_02285 [Chloroflexota bacterium]